MMKPFSTDAMIEQMRRENTHDEEQRLVIIGNGVDGNPYADDNRIWVRDIGSIGEGDYSTGGVAYRVLAGTGYLLEIDHHVWIQWQPGPNMWQVVMSDPDFMQVTGRSMHLLNSNDPHNKFQTTEGLMPLLSKPLPNGYANVQGWQFVTEDGQYGDYKGTSDVPTAISRHAHVLSLAPETAAHHAYVLLAFNITKFFAGTEDPIEMFVSTSKSWLTPLDATDIQECLDQMSPNSRSIKAYRVYTGQDDLRGHADDRDLRGWLNVPSRNSMESFEIAGDSGTPFDIEDANTFTFEGAGGIEAITDDATKTIIIDGSGIASGITQLTGDVTAGPGSGSQAATLATVNTNVGTYENATVTANGKGLITGISSGLGYTDEIATWGESIGSRWLVRRNQSNTKWFATDEDHTSFSMSAVRGVVSDAGTGVFNTQGRVRTRGVLGDFIGLTAGANMYVGTINGLYTQTEPTPTLGGNTVMNACFGYAISTTQMMVDIQPVKYMRRASLADGDTLTVVHHADATLSTRKLSAAISSVDTIVLETSGGAQDSARQLRGLSGAGSVNVVDAAGASNVALGDTGGTDFRVAQSWQASAAGRVSSITFRAGATTGAPSAFPSWSIEADDGTGKPSGVALAGGTMASWNASADNTITVTDGPFQATGETLWFVLQLPMQATNNNYIVIRNASGAYVSGVMKWESTTGGSFPGTWGLGGGTNDMRVSITLAAVAANDAIGQGFSHSSTTTVNYADLLLKKTGTPTGNLTLAIYSNTSGLPNAVITNGTADVVAASTLTTGYTLIRFTFSTPPTITASTQYHLVLTTADSASNTNYVEWGTDASSPPYANGSLALLQSASWAAASPAADGIFDLYGVGSTFGSITVPGLWISTQSDIVARNDNGSGSSSATNTTFKNTSGVTLDVTCIVEMP